MPEETESRPAIAVTLNGREAAARGWEILSAGGSALDAVETAVRAIEDNPDDWSVGYGGFPNFAGDVELDASISDGRNLAIGAVAGIRKHRNPVSVARRVMERTPHVLLAGEGADRFASSQGFEEQPLLTDRMRETYRKLMKGEQIDLWPRVEEEPAELARAYGGRLLEVARQRSGWKEIYCAEIQGTCNAMARDVRGDIACAVSTSGLALKMPGRVGDSPIPGAGCYADNRYGAAACCGNGELCMRLCSARMAVYYLSQGLPAAETAAKCLLDLNDLPDRKGGFQILVMDRFGNAASAFNLRAPRFYCMTGADDRPRLVTGRQVEVQTGESLV